MCARVPLLYASGSRSSRVFIEAPGIKIMSSEYAACDLARLHRLSIDLMILDAYGYIVPEKQPRTRKEAQRGGRSATKQSRTIEFNREGALRAGNAAFVNARAIQQRHRSRSWRSR